MKTVCHLICIACLLAACNTHKQKEQAPDEHRYRKLVLAEGLSNPLMFDFAADGRLYLIEMAGDIKMYNQHTKAWKTIGSLPTFDGNEFGLIGMVLDNDFIKNGFIYLQYFPKDSLIAHISRFTIKKDSLDRQSEQLYLRIPYENHCCHTAGSMAMDGNGNLYAATADNADAFFTHYALTDDRAGNSRNDALRSAGNTQDYRGKIIRIHPGPNGGYTIPDGNLFPKNGKQGKPEIYVMGLRNPFRMAVDKKTGYVYWGEVGPDAGNDSTRGPKGHDEFNRAREAGNFGWPLFIGNNKPYAHVYFAQNDSVGERFDPLHPVNFSANNTGAKELPPAQPALMYYPYDTSNAFPSFGKGGRTAIGGPVYHFNDDDTSSIKFPRYFENCWFIAEWMRNWIKVVHLTKDADIDYIEDFMPGTEFKKPIYMKFGPDGTLYMIEFGPGWQNNIDTRLVKIEYVAGNRPPVAVARASDVYGKLPFKVQLHADSSYDYDNDSLQYTWTDDQGKTIAQGPQLQQTFSTAGEYHIILIVQDAHKAIARDTISLMAGNAMPEVKIQVANQTFYRDTVAYTVQVRDAEDGIDPPGVTVRMQPIPNGSSVNKGQVHMRGEVLMNESDCKACHQMNAPSVGPSFEQIAHKYNTQPNMIPKLAAKILRGGSGVWGEAAMSAHPQLTLEQSTEIVKYIYNLKLKPAPVSSLPVQGVVRIPISLAAPGAQRYWLQATYTDKGATGIKALTQQATLVLRAPTIFAAEFDKVYDGIVNNGNMYGTHNSHAGILHIDLTGIQQLQLWARGHGVLEMHLDAPNGPLIGKTGFDEKGDWQLLSTALQPTTGFHDLYILFVNEKHRFTGINIEWVRFNNRPQK
jgi:cytochrome c